MNPTTINKSPGRIAAEKSTIDFMMVLDPSGLNAKVYQEFFETLQDEAAFKAFMELLASGKAILPIQIPNLSKVGVTIDTVLAASDYLGHSLFERIWMDEQDGTPMYLTPERYMVVKLPLRRQVQMLDKKISVSEDNNSIDDLTGQPTGKSKGSKISYPELQVIGALGLDYGALELMNARGGNGPAFNAMNASISQTGGADLDVCLDTGGVPDSTLALHTILTAMHLGTTLMEGR